MLAPRPGAVWGGGRAVTLDVPGTDGGRPAAAAGWPLDGCAWDRRANSFRFLYIFVNKQTKKNRQSDAKYKWKAG